MIFSEVILEGKNRDVDFLDESGEREKNSIYIQRLFLVVHNDLN